MAKYHIRHTQELHNGAQTIYYQGDKVWSTEYDQRKIYNKKIDTKSELYDFGGEIVKENNK
jgi:hypothetical protein